MVREWSCGGSDAAMTARNGKIATLLALYSVFMGGCAIARSTPPPPRAFGEIVGEETGVIVSVHDTMIDLRTGQSRSLQAHTPPVALGPIAVALPVSIGGESRRDVPGEEITVRLPSGKLILVVQELSHPAFAREERVRVLHERPNLVTGESRSRVVREDEEVPAPAERR